MFGQGDDKLAPTIPVVLVEGRGDADDLLELDQGEVALDAHADLFSDRLEGLRHLALLQVVQDGIKLCLDGDDALALLRVDNTGLLESLLLLPAGIELGC